MVETLEIYIDEVKVLTDGEVIIVKDEVLDEWSHGGFTYKPITLPFGKVGLAVLSDSLGVRMGTLRSGAPSFARTGSVRTGN